MKSAAVVIALILFGVTPSALLAADPAADPNSVDTRLKAAMQLLKEPSDNGENEGETDYLKPIHAPEAVTDVAGMEKAVKIIESIMADQPRNPDLLVRLGDAYAAGARFQEAEKAYQLALDIDRDNTAALSRFADVKARQGKIADAIERYKRVVELVPGQAKPHARLAELYYGQERFDDAIDEQKKVVAADETASESRLNLARLLFDKAQAVYAREQKADHEKGAAEQHQGETIKNAAEWFKMSAAELQAAAHRYPGHYDTYITAGEMLIHLRDYPRAERMFQDACRVRPKSCEAWNNLGFAIAQQGRPQAAIQAFEKAFECNPNYEPARKNLEFIKKNPKPGQHSSPTTNQSC